MSSDVTRAVDLMVRRGKGRAVRSMLARMVVEHAPMTTSERTAVMDRLALFERAPDETAAARAISKAGHVLRTDSVSQILRLCLVEDRLLIPEAAFLVCQMRKQHDEQAVQQNIALMLCTLLAYNRPSV